MAIQASTLRVSIVGDSKDAQRSLKETERAIDRLSGKNVTIDANTEALEAGVARAKKSVDGLTKGQHSVRMSVDATAAKAEVENLKRRLGGIPKDTEFSIQADTLGAQLKLARLEEKLASLDDGNIEVDADTARAIAQLGSLKFATDRIERKVNIDVDTGNAQSNVTGLGGALRELAGGGALVLASWQALKFPAMASGASFAAGAVGQLSAAAIGLAASLSQVAGVIPALAVAGSAVGQGFATVAGAFFGVGDALKGYSAEQKKATSAAISGSSSASSSAKAQRAAAQAVEDATDSLAESRRQAERSIQNAVEARAQAEEDALAQVARAQRQVEDAGVSLALSQEREQLAQERLTQARKDAAEELEDLTLSVERATLSEERAQLNLEQARARANDPKNLKTALDHRDVALDVRDAELALKEAIERRGDEQARLTQIQATGIDGSQRVVDAQRDLRDAQRGVIDAQRSAADATKNLAEVQVDSAERVAKAQEAVVLAHEDGARRIEQSLKQLERAQQSAAESTESMASGGAASVDKFAEAMSQLGPEAQSFVNTLIGFRQPLLDLRDIAAAEMFPGFEAGLKSASVLLDDFRPIAASTGQAVGNLGQKFGEMLGSPAWRGDLVKLGEGNVRIIEIFGDAALDVADALRHVLIAAQPLTEWLANTIGGWAKSAAGAAEMGRETGKLGSFFDRTRETLQKLFDIVGNLAGVFKNVFSAARPLGDWMLDNFVKLTERAKELTGSMSGENSMRKFFDDAKPALLEFGRLILDVGKGLGSIFQAVGPAIAPLVAEIRTKVLPPLIDLFSHMNSDFLSSIVDLTAAAIRFLDTFGTATPFLTSLVGGIADVANAAVDLVDALGPVGDILIQIMGVLSAAGLISGLLKLYAAFKTLFSAGAGLRLLSGEATGLGGALGGLGSQQGAMAGLASKIGLVGAAIAGLIQAKSKFDEGKNEGFGSLGLMDVVQFGTLPMKVAGALGNELGVLKSKAEETMAVVGQLAASAGSGLAAGFEAATDAARRFVDKIVAATEAQRNLLGVNVSAESAQLSLERAVISATEATDRYGAESLEARTSNNQLKQAALGVADANIRQAEETAKLSGRTLTQEQRTDIMRQALFNAANAMNGPAAEALRNMAYNLMGAGLQAHGASGQVAGLRDNALSVPDVFIKIQQSGAGEAAAALGTLANAGLGSIPILGAFNQQQQGGTVPGTGSGDIVPTLLEPGEFVVRKAVTNQMGRQWMEALNDGQIAKHKQGGLVQQFAAGGLVHPVKWKIEVEQPPSGYGSGGPGGAVGGLTERASQMVRDVLANFPGQRMTSGYRSPAQNAAVGGASNSDHMYGRAADFAPGSDAVASFLRNYPNIKQVLWQVAGHYDHVHGAVYDKGGWLPPGLTMAYNGTGKSERVGGGGNVYVTIGTVIGPGGIDSVANQIQAALLKKGRRNPGIGLG